ncbi:MAG: inositol monophosphatase family protein [Coriobacteriales bacterium]|nr:inositol monophosphatase [Actinomycetes bacterium]
MDHVLETAVAAARAGGEVLRARLRHIGRVRAKTNEFDVVTDTDIAAGVEVVRTILERDPNAVIVIEEPEVYEITGIDEGTLDAERVWVIDPLDGTTSYVHGFPCYSTSVALLEDGQPVAGAVYNVPLDEVTYAARGQGAFLADTCLHCTDADDLTHSLVITGFPYDRGELLTRQMEVFSAIVPIAEGVRRDGSAAVDCCHVAAGRADAFWEFGLKPWDMAAGVIALREAGATVTGIDGEPWTARSTGIIAAGPNLHGILTRIICA